MTSSINNKFFTLKEKEFLLRSLAYMYETIENKQELTHEVIFLELDSKQEYLELIINITSKLMQYNIDFFDLDKEQIKKHFTETLTKEDIKKILRG